LFDSLNQLVTGSPVTYLVIAGVIVADAILPLLPSETLVIAAAVLSAQGRLLLPLIILAAGCGALVGDNANYWIGRSLGVRAVRRLLRGEKGRGRLRWGQEQVEEHGARLIIVARFIPGGRIATTLAAGTLEMDWRRFFAADLAGAVLWSSSIALIGYFGGSAFGHETWKALLLAFGIALVATALVEGVRRLRARGAGGRRGAHGSA
jgi:membrane-associated protein